MFVWEPYILFRNQTEPRTQKGWQPLAQRVTTLKQQSRSESTLPDPVSRRNPAFDTSATTSPASPDGDGFRCTSTTTTAGSTGRSGVSICNHWTGEQCHINRYPKRVCRINSFRLARVLRYSNLKTINKLYEHKSYSDKSSNYRDARFVCILCRFTFVSDGPCESFKVCVAALARRPVSLGFSLLLVLFFPCFLIRQQCEPISLLFENVFDEYDWIRFTTTNDVRLLRHGKSHWR